MSKIAVFDSGLGGLTVLSALRKELPDEDYIYFGDSANAPYGDKTTEELLRLNTAVLVRGSDLHVDQLSLDTGELRITGRIDCMEYDDNRASGGFLRRLFQ